MQILIDEILNVINKKEVLHFKEFINKFNFENVHWLLLSDYCISDKNKYNDVITFSLLVNHDRLDNINNYIKSIAPVDLKKTSDISIGFLQYLNSPLIYHFSIVISKDQYLLKKFLSREIMDYVIKDLIHIINNAIQIYPHLSEYYYGVLERIKNINIDMQRKTFNDNLLRKMFLVGSFGAAIIYFLKQNSNPKSVVWISDRDAIVQKFDGFVFDYMSIMYNMQPLDKLLTQDIFELRFQDIPLTGINVFDELIRIPDFVAGTLASYSLQNRDRFTDMNIKHKKMIIGAMTNAVNQVNLKIEFDNLKLSIYSFKWKAEG